MACVTVERYHDISAGHRVVGHEGKCRSLHGHNYRVTFTCEAEQLDDLGRVIDFSVIKEKLCMWLEEHWDHRMLLWEKDPLRMHLENALTYAELDEDSVHVVPFNPTAENMALHLLNVIGPMQLTGTGVVLVRVNVSETRKCAATASN